MYVEGRRIMPAASSPPFREARFYSCPVAEALDAESWVGRALEIFRWSGGGERLSEVVDAPTLAAWEVVDILGAEVDAIDDLYAEILRERDEHKRRAQDLKNKRR